MLFLVVAALAFFFYAQYNKTKALLNQKDAAVKEAKSLIEEVSKLAILPSKEQPTIATVQDKTKLQNQTFFSQAENGDKVLIYTGDIGGDLLTRRGHITGTRTLAGSRVSIAGQAPLGELQTYTSRLKSITGGEGTYVLEFSHYEAVPPGLQQALVNDYKPVIED